MWGIFKNIFGGSDVIKKGAELLDEAFYTDEEKAQDKQKLIELKAQKKIELLSAYAPFKVAQRYLALMFAFVFVFIMLNGVIGALYGVVDMQNVERAKEFANSMWLGQIMMTIVGFYFGGGFLESMGRTKK